jgi:ankyrin repeat protein
MKKHYSPVFEMIRNQDLAALAEFASTNPDFLDHRDSFEATPLHTAAEFGNPEMVRWLLERGAVVDALNEHEETPLFEPGWSHSVAIARLLVERGADPDHRDYDGCGTPLSNAIRRADLPLVEYLTSLGVDISEVIHDITEQTPLVLALDRGYEPVAKHLLDLDPPIGRTDSQGRHELHYAAIAGFAEIASRLVDRGIDSSLKDSYGKTSLDYAEEGRGRFQAIVDRLRDGTSSE